MGCSKDSVKKTCSVIVRVFDTVSYLALDLYFSTDRRLKISTYFCRNAPTFLLSYLLRNALLTHTLCFIA